MAYHGAWQSLLRRRPLARGCNLRATPQAVVTSRSVAVLAGSSRSSSHIFDRRVLWRCRSWPVPVTPADLWNAAAGAAAQKHRAAALTNAGLAARFRGPMGSPDFRPRWTLLVLLAGCSTAPWWAVAAAAAANSAVGACGQPAAAAAAAAGAAASPAPMPTRAAEVGWPGQTPGLGGGRLPYSVREEEVPRVEWAAFVAEHGDGSGGYAQPL